MNRKNFCLYPFAAFSLDNSGKPRICCNNDGWDRVTSNKPISDKNFNILDEYNNSFHKEVRKFIIEDKRHPSCKKCWDIEDEGKTSWREWFNESFDVPLDEEFWIKKCDSDGTIDNLEFLYLDITFGNKCNLKCVMCNGYNSTLFLKEQFETKQIGIIEYQKLLKLDWFEDSDCFEKIYDYVKSVQRIHILGGEPLIIEHQDFLKKIIEMGISKNIILSYNSNLTKLPTEILSCWKEFKRVYLCVSVDAYKELNEFIRYPMSWDKLIKNLETVDNISKTQNNISIQIHSTFSSLNCESIIDFLEWMKEISNRYTSIDPHPMFNYVYYPLWSDPANLPSDVKIKTYQQYLKWENENQEYLNKGGNHQRLDMLKSYLEKIVKSPQNDTLWKTFLEKIKFYERVRNIKYK